MKRTGMALAALAFAAVALAQMTKYKDWAKSPEAYFLTPSERVEWAKVSTDADAEKFIAVYYAKRGGDKFKDEIERRVAAADNQFKLRRQRGAESTRGHLLIVLGGPSRVSSTRAQEHDGLPSDATAPSLSTKPDTGGAFGGTPPTGVTQTWIYTKEKFDPSWGITDLSARISVDPGRGSDELQNRAEVERVLNVVVEKSIVNAGAQPAGAPMAAGAASGAMAPAVPPAATGATASSGASASMGASTAPAPAPSSAPALVPIPAATRALIDAMKTKGEGPGYWGGSFHSIPGDSFFALELATSSDKAPGATARFAGVVTDDAGKEVATYWEEVPLAEAKTGVRTEKLYERSISLPPGTYKGTFALFAADGTTPLASGSDTLQIPAKNADFEVSPMIIASVLTPLTKRPSPMDPFVFGMDKPIRVDPKASRLFSKEESLWYFYTVSNPTLPAAPAAAAAPASAVAAGGPVAAAAPAPVPEVKPRIMTRLSVLRDGKPAFAPATVPAELQPLAPGYYATGSEIPLTSFEPGFYTFALNIRDLNAPRDSAANKGIDRKQDFIVLKADGSMPDKAAPAPPPAAKPKPAKK